MSTTTPELDLRAAPPEIRQIARKLFWWKSETEALADPIRFVAQVMALGTWRDAQATRRALGDDSFFAALRNPPPGVLDERSWNYWHRVFHIQPVPPLPTRNFA